MFASRRVLWLALWSLCSSVAAQDPTTEATSPPTAVRWGGCEDPTNGKSLVTIGQKTTICLTISDGANWTEARTYMRLNFQPIADEYSRFSVPNSFKEMIVDTGTDVSDRFAGKDIALHASSQSALSFQKKYRDDAEGRVFPFLTVIVDVLKGVVQGVAWDDASIFCGLKKVQRNTFDFDGKAGDEARFGQPVDGCYFTEDECKSQKACDLLLHVVWTGTDSKGKSFLSSSYRYSAFPPQEWGSRLTGVLPNVDLQPFDGQ